MPTPIRAVAGGVLVVLQNTHRDRHPLSVLSPLREPPPTDELEAGCITVLLVAAGVLSMPDAARGVTRPHPRLVEVADVAVVSMLMKLLAACGVKEPIHKRRSTKDKQCCSEPFSHAHQRTAAIADVRQKTQCSVLRNGLMPQRWHFNLSARVSAKVATEIATPKI